MKPWLLLICVLLFKPCAFAYLIYQPVSFSISTEKEIYFEGEKITFYITITNHDKEKSHPVLLPHTQNIGQKLFYLNAYDKAQNALLLRYTEDKMLNMLVHDTGSVKIKYLKPLEQIVITIYLNDFENYYNYHTQNASHHSFGVPLFAGIYNINITYNPKGISLGDSIYTYYEDFEKTLPITKKDYMPVSGQVSTMIKLKIKRSADTIVNIERKNYFIKTNGHYFYYMSENLPQIVTDIRCHHITSILPDSCAAQNEYFYNYFNNVFAEYISRFEDGDIKEYRKFRDGCPNYLHTERYNAFKQKTHFEMQLPDKRFYSVSFHQPGGNIHQESYCAADGTLCVVTNYVYNEKGVLKRKDITQTQPCNEIELDQKKK